MATHPRGGFSVDKNPTLTLSPLTGGGGERGIFRRPRDEKNEKGDRFVLVVRTRVYVKL